MDWPVILQRISLVLMAITTLCYAYQFVYLFLPLFKKRKPQVQGKLHRYAIMIPARNEEKVIGHLLQSINGQDYPKELISVYVVADNCTDRTAAVAETYGAKVFPRNNKTQVGKGYALAYLLEQIDQTDGLDSFDAFLVFDADNLLLPDYISQINTVCAQGYEAFCGYRNTKNFGSSWMASGYGVWYLHDSAHLNQSRMMLGSSCTVNGTGFGFTRQALEKCGGWNFFTLTEDLEFSMWCASHGVKVGYCHDAILFDEQPLTFKQSWKQRTRWVQGGVQIVFKRSAELFKGMFKGGWMSYACFEAATLTMWGYLFGVISGLVGAAALVLTHGLSSLVWALAMGVAGAYLSFLAMGALTMAMEWKRVHAKTRHKIMGIFAFPLFMLSFVPIVITAPFRKFQWTPIEHTVAVSTESVLSE